MNKSELKTGMRVETREGETYLVIKDIDSRRYGHQDVAFVNGSFLEGTSFNEDLTHKRDNDYDIVKVFNCYKETDTQLINGILDLKIKYLIWTCQEYTDKQKEVFKALKTLGFNWIARDKGCDDLYAYSENPWINDDYDSDTWLNTEDGRCASLDNNLFDFIKCGDEPFKIPEV